MDTQQRLDELERKILDIEKWITLITTKLKDILNKLVEMKEQENKFKELDKIYQERFQPKYTQEDFQDKEAKNETDIGRPFQI